MPENLGLWLMGLGCGLLGLAWWAATLWAAVEIVRSFRLLTECRDDLRAIRQELAKLAAAIEERAKKPPP